ncbi:Ran-binding protein 10 [Tyrophagus putrescentiae]|nr:Ran-binding protein 10 [Tyrophagus putrescentiae]
MSRPISPVVEMETSRCSSPVSPASPSLRQAEGIERLKRLYPYTDVDLLPKNWSSKDKANFIILSEDGLKVHYKGVGKTHKDAAAVRATHPIPSSCLLYYYEVRIVSKGRDGYMGIGLAAQNVDMHRLPGWDKQSYGYHGDDGHSFNSSGTGQAYGPTFTTGDIIGCGFNLIENKCFYTKNGINLGIAFTDLASVPLFPTVGLQTPGEELEANFGLDQFVYDIEQDVIALRKRITESIGNFPVNHADWQPMLHYLVQSWLIHNGYCTTAQVFSEATQLPFKENVQNIKQRLKIQQSVLSGRIGEAVHLTNTLYPEVLQENPNLYFTLKCRQFIEYVCGYDRAPYHAFNGNCQFNDHNGNLDNPMEVDISPEDTEHSVQDPLIESHATNGYNELEKIIKFGRELNALSKQLFATYGHNETNKKMLEQAFHIIAFQNPTDYKIEDGENLLDREQVCQQLNNAIVKASSGSQKVPIETVIKHTKNILKLNSQCGAWLLEKL